ncbi:MAG: hypothetical protein H6955_18635 [Chromatiaceae bacterium]|nr:hypothetical protein [Chromatiaceae bacterium]
MPIALRDEMQPLLNKVPEVTLFFWIIKVFSTTVGETAADYLNFNLHLGLTGTSVVMTGLLLGLLIAQVKAERYIPWRYWSTVVLISVVGTLITDNLTDNFGVPLEATTLGFSLALGLTFLLWHRSERTLSIHSIFTRRRELYYWAAILFTFALGTAAGDWVAEGLNMGFIAAAILFGGLIVLVTLAHYWLVLRAVPAFWMAYVLTRPLGAACGDLLIQPPADGGLGMDNMWVNAAFLITIVTLVLYLTFTRKDVTEMRESA